MKKLFLAATLAACSAVPAFAQQYYYSGQGPYGYQNPYGYQSSYPYFGSDVVVDGDRIVGQDPDPNVRSELQRNANCYLNGCAD